MPTEAEKFHALIGACEEMYAEQRLAKFRPTRNDIARVIVDLKNGQIFDPSQHAHFWECRLYSGDRHVGGGEGSTPAEAAAYSWINFHAPDLDNPEQLADVPLECHGDAWRFELTPPKPDTASDVDDGVSQFVVVSDIDGFVHGPYHSFNAALVDAEDSDGTVFKLVRVEEGER